MLVPLPSMVATLIEQIAEPLILASAASPSLSVVAASSVARSVLDDAPVGSPLSAWIGERAAAEVWSQIVAGVTDGTAGPWSWRLTTSENERWIICRSGHLQRPIRSRILATTDEATLQAATANDLVLIATYEAALAVASELELGSVLQRIVDLARTVVPAGYAALGVSDEYGRIEQFITSGLTTEERTAIGPIPEGHGLLGELIRERVPLLVPDIAAHPRSVGFPPNHPPMRSLLGTPILLGERVLGNLYLTERLEGEGFNEDDLAAVQILAAHAAAAIDRAHLYRQVEIGRTRAEEQRDQLRVILDSLPSGVMIGGADGAMELANTSALDMIFGNQPPSGTLPMYGRDFQMLQPDGAPLPASERPVNRALRGETVRNRQLLLESGDGSRLPILVQAAPLRSAAGTIDRAVVVMQDVTRLREAEQLKDDFLSLISHEVRTPLTAIHGGAYMLANQGRMLDEETRSELLADIVVESQRLERMLTNLLGLTAIMAGRFVANTEPVLIGPLARQVAAEVAERSPNHTFAVDVPNDLQAAECDPALLGQVLRNLYENAVKYSPHGGEIRTSASLEDKAITIRIADQGIGIAPDQVGRVFERFHRAGADSTVRGMGLGLYLSRSLVEAQGGRIEASSPGLGQGATFSVTLPVARDWQDPTDD